MDFLKILKAMVDNINGGYAATIMAMDGIPLQDYVKEGETCDLETIGVEYGKIVLEIKKASEVLNLGDVDEVIISSNGMKVILRIATPEYFVALVLSPTGNSGKGRYLIKKAARDTAKELVL